MFTKLVLKFSAWLRDVQIKHLITDVTNKPWETVCDCDVKTHKNKKKGRDKEDSNPFLLQPHYSKVVNEYTNKITHNTSKLPKERTKSRSSNSKYSFESQEPTEAFIAIKASPSGFLTMEFDEFLYNNFEAISQGDEDFFVYLKLTDSGRFYLDNMRFENKALVAKLQMKLKSNGEIAFDIVSDKVFDSGANIETTKTRSKLAIESSSDLIDVVKSNKSESAVFDFQRIENLYMTDEEQERILHIIELKRRRKESFFPLQKQTAQQQRLKEMELNYKEYSNTLENIVFENQKDAKTVQVCSGTNDELNEILVKDELKQFYNKSNMKMNITVVENGVPIHKDVNIKITPSGNIALDVETLDAIGEISNLTTECPIHLSRSPSGKFKLFVGYQYDKDNKVPNALLRRTASNGLLVVTNEPVMKSVAIEQTPSIYNNDVYKVKMRYGKNDNHTLLPAVLKTSPSSNYLVVMDKEFERKYLNSLNSVLDENSECNVEVQKCGSTVFINFQDNCNQNAILIKTPSDTIKLLVNGPLYKKLLGNNQNKSKKTLEDIEHLLSELYHECKINLNEQTKSVMFTSVKFSSDSNLRKNINMADNFLAKSTTKFQQSEAGQYAAILDKESMRSFLNDLKNQITNRFKSLPIKETNSGEIIIIFDPNNAHGSQFGSLKITASGNLYVNLDEKALKDTVKKESEHTETFSEQLQLGSEHMIKKIIDPKDKAVGSAWPHSKLGNKSSCDSETCSSYKSCSTSKCSSQKDENSKSNCTCSESTQDKNVHSYYVSEIVDRYKHENLSKEISKITSLCLSCERLLNKSSITDSRSSLESIPLASDSSIEWQWQIPDLCMGP